MPVNLSYSAKQRLARRTADITRLQEGFKQATETYQTKATEATKAYQEQSVQYDAAYGGYEQRFNAYKQRGDQYNTALEKYLTTAPVTAPSGATVSAWDGYRYGGAQNVAGVKLPVRQVNNEFYWGDISGSKYGEQWSGDLSNYVKNLGAYGSVRGRYFTLAPGFEYIPMGSGIRDTYGNEYGYLQKRGGPDPGAFTEQFTETAPTAPTAPDLSAERAKLKEEQAYVEREVDERTKARLRAVKRSGERPMLSAGTSLTGASNG